MRHVLDLWQAIAATLGREWMQGFGAHLCGFYAALHLFGVFRGAHYSVMDATFAPPGYLIVLPLTLHAGIAWRFEKLAGIGRIELSKWNLLLPGLWLLLVTESWAGQTFSADGQPAQLVELYTSEGCSSCPPADKRMAQLLERSDLWRGVVPVVFHVDYWDYLGWRDRFARPQYTDRQRSMKSRGQIRALYTPGWIIDGLEWRGYFHQQGFPEVTLQQGGNLTVAYQQGQLRIDYQAPSVQIKQGPFQVHAVLMGFDYQSRIQRGENRGLELEHQFVVLDMQSESGSGHWQLAFAEQTPAEGLAGSRRALAVWVTEVGSIKPLQVLGGWLD